MNRKTCVAKADDRGDRMLEAAISTISVDRDGDVLLPSGIRTEEFKRNPMVLLGHDASRFPIGRATTIRQTPRAVVAEMVFAERPKEYPPKEVAEWIPDTVYDLFEQGVLNAFSVGFTIDDYRAPTKKDINRFGDNVRRVITSWNLLEFSVVTIPANQDALVMAVKDHQLDPKSGLFDILPTARVLDTGPRILDDIVPRMVRGLD